MEGVWRGYGGTPPIVLASVHAAPAAVHLAEVLPGRRPTGLPVDLRGHLRRDTAAAAAAAQGLTLVHFSAQPEPFLTQNTP